jgi:integrase
MRIYKRGKVYWAQYRGERVSLKTTDREAAERGFRELQRSTVDPTYRAPDQTSLSVALEEFAAAQGEKGRSAASIKRTGISGSHLVRVLGDVPVASIAATDVDRYVGMRHREGASRLTVARELQALRGTLKIMRRRGSLVRSVDEIMPTDFAVDYKPLDRHLTFEQIGRLRRELQPERAAVVGFITATAADWRSVELAQPGDVDLQAATVLVRGTKNPKRWRTLPVLPKFRPWLVAAVEHMPFAPWGNVNRDIRAACVRAELPEVTPRDLRRSHAKILRGLGVEPSLVASMLGHKDSRMVERVYGRLAPEELGRLVVAQAKTGTKTVQRRHRKRRKAA